jgi:dynein light chain LC8-type
MSERKAVIKNADMSEDMQQDAVDCASQALEKYNIEKVRIIARFTKSLFTSQSTFKYFLSKMSRVSL